MASIEGLFHEWLDSNGEDIICDEVSIADLIEQKLRNVDFDDIIKTTITELLTPVIAEELHNQYKQQFITELDGINAQLEWILANMVVNERKRTWREWLLSSIDG